MRLLMIQHVACEGPGLLHDLLEQNGWETDIRCMDIPGITLPENLNGYDAFIILGGPMGAYEEERYPYLYIVENLVLEAAARDIPTIGICLGGQIIARSLGAEVAPNPVKEIGWSLIKILDEGKTSRLFHGAPDFLSVFQWHGDTFALPEGAVLLASSQECKNQAFVYHDHIWALQFHLEVNPDMIQSWSKMYRDELIAFAGPGAPDRLMRNTLARWQEKDAYREQFLQNLATILKGRLR
jgi:GMP synthase-like glutamine amidotransferase